MVFTNYCHKTVCAAQKYVLPCVITNRLWEPVRAIGVTVRREAEVPYRHLSVCYGHRAANAVILEGATDPD